MATRELERSLWDVYLNRISDHIRASSAEIRIEGKDVGDMAEARNLPFRGMTYDHKDDSLEIELEGLSHRIAHPERILLLEDIEGLHAMEIVDREGRRQILKLTQVLALPG